MNSMIFAAAGSISGLKSGAKTQTRRAPNGFMVSLPEPVYSDPYPGRRAVCAARGFYSARLNPHGAVSINVDTDVAGGSARRIEPFDLGVKPGEFHFVVPQLGHDGQAARGSTHLADFGKRGKRWAITPLADTRLWVREKLERAPELDTPEGRHGATYMDGTPCPFLDTWKWKHDYLSPYFLPFAMRRFELAIASVKLEKLHDISDEDAAAEGFGDRSAFVAAWASLHGEDAWALNPWVFAFTFAVFDRTKGL
jgi:hypothetical protein